MVSNSILRATAIILTVTGVFVASNIYTLIPIYENISRSLQVSESHIAAGGSLFTLFYAIGLLYFGPASDRLGRRKIIVFGMLASSLSTLTVGLSDHLISLYISRSIQGLTLGSFAPVAFAYSFDLFTPKKRTLLLVFINTGFLMAGIIGQLISSSITFYLHWSFVFYFFAVSYFTLFVVSFFILPKTKQPERENQSVYKIMCDLLRNKSLIKCYMITISLLFSFVALYDAIGNDFAGGSHQLFLLRAVGLIRVVLSLFTGKLIDRFGVSATMNTGFLIGAFSLIVMTFFNGLYVLMLFSILFVASISLLIPTIITLIGTLGGIHRAKALSLYSFMLLTGASLAPLVVILIDFNSVMVLLLFFFIANIITGYLLSKELKFIT